MTTTDSDPVGRFEPDQAPLALHDWASCADQVIVVLWPTATIVGLAVKSTGIELPELPPEPFPETEIWATAVSLPPAPVQVKTKMYCPALSISWVSVPESGKVPDHEPEAEQELASVELHVSVTLCPTVNAVGDAMMMTFGAGVVLPPPPQAVSTVARNSGKKILKFMAQTFL